MVYKISPKLAVVILLICGIFALFSGEVGFAIFMFVGVGVWMYIIKDFSREGTKTEDVQDSKSDNDEDKPS